MSRVATQKTSPVAPKRDARHTNGIASGGGGGSSGLQDDRCPVCRSSRYLNANLRFLVNPECYHKMCESCVDRIFSHGPAACPVRGCGRTLRKHRFREQTFEDITVEREVDVRRRVATVFNRREDEFEDNRAYNDYLNDVEDITFNLVNGIDIEATERRFQAYKTAHEQEILANASLAEQERSQYAARQKLERDEAKRRREAARREDVEERKELAANRRNVLDRLAAGQDAEQVTKDGQQVTLKKRMDRNAAAERQRQLHAATELTGVNGKGAMVIKGLKARQNPAPEEPVDPFGGLNLENRKYFVLQRDYVWTGVQETKNDPLVGAGGYDVDAFTTRALCEAFGGLGVFLDEENPQQDRTNESAAAIGTVRAEVGVRESKLQDPF